MKKKDGPTIMDSIGKAEARIAELKTEIKGKDEVIALLRLENSQLGEENQEQREVIKIVQSEKAYFHRLKATQESEIEKLKEENKELKAEKEELKFMNRLYQKKYSGKHCCLALGCPFLMRQDDE